MPRKEKVAQKTILLICEGKNTEPYYFRSIKDKIHNEGIWENVAITIIPKPIQSEEIEIDKSIHKTRRKQRLIRNNDVRTGLDVEENYKAEPIRFIREAQLLKSQDTFDEAWAIFDNDSRKPNNIETAFGIAKNEDLGIVKIAYSSIAFEHWYLLHFERSVTPFQKSECRIGDKVLHCNSGEHENDCYGVRCIGGYLRHQGYVNISTKKQESLFPYLEPHLDQALFNSTWLRNNISRVSPPATPHYLTNPYTDVDELVKYLLKIPRNYIWAELNTEVVMGGVIVHATLIVGILSVRLTNQSATAKILREGTCIIVDAEFNQLFVFKREVIYSADTIIQNVDLTQIPNPKYYKIVLEESHLYISLI